MRFIIYGVGAIGGTLAGFLHRAGHEAIGIARGRHLEAIRENGLRLRAPDADLTVPLSCVGDPAEIGWRPGDVVLLTVKGQDTGPALEGLRAAGVREQAIVCGQNGVANERQALRLFENVYGMTVMLPAVHLAPGAVDAFGVPRHGIFDIGRYPAGTDATVETIVAALETANFAAFARNEIMRSKYGKLYLNLENVIDAAFGSRSRESGLAELARAECERVYAAAGIGWDDLGADSARREQLMRDGEIEGADRVGSSSAQSLRRHAGSIETDWLNGEIVLLGRLHGVPVPVNAFLVGLGHRLIAERREPGSLDPVSLRAELDAQLETS